MHIRTFAWGGHLSSYLSKVPGAESEIAAAEKATASDKCNHAHAVRGRTDIDNAAHPSSI
jgi:hypothetical protein